MAAPSKNERTPLLATVVIARPKPRYPHSRLRQLCTYLLALALVASVVAFLIPTAYDRWHDPHHHEGPPPPHRPHPDILPHAKWPSSEGLSHKKIAEILLETPKAEKARESAEYYMSGAHLAGKNLSQAEWTRDLWSQYGVSHTEIIPYDVYINYPLGHRLALLEANGAKSLEPAAAKDYKVKIEFSLEEDVLEEDPTTGRSDRIPTFHGYSASGNVTGRYVYANFGTYEDFEELQARNVSLHGHIAVVKYGKIFRGLKVKRAAELGMIGVVIYTDPQEDGEITELNGYKPYPEGPARQPSSVQRGSTQFLSLYPGDPTTKGYPSKPGVPRQEPSSIPTIPSLPLSYEQAIPLLKQLNGHGPRIKSGDWLGGLQHKDVKYNIGPSPEGLVLNLVNEQEYVTTPLWNTIGIINGTIESEVVVIGNHRDAWIIGGADPNSGSAALNEVIRSFGVAMSHGWKPLRTIVFASWDGEEYGLVGSTEWVEEYLPWLKASTVAYLNVDVGTAGVNFDASASPLLNQVLYQATSLVQSPNQTISGQSVGDIWKAVSGRHISTMGSGSDFTAFQDFAGIPSLSIGFGGGNQAVYHYHSNYDSFAWMEKYGDHGFHYHEAIAKILNMALFSLVETPIIPFNTVDYANGLDTYLEKVIKKGKSSKSAVVEKFSFKGLQDAVSSLKDAAVSFEQKVDRLKEEVSEETPWWNIVKRGRLYAKVKIVNEKYKILERQFLYEPGLDGRDWFKHLVFAPGRWTGYAGATFPGLVEAIEDEDKVAALKWSKIIEAKIRAAGSLLK